MDYLGIRETYLEPSDVKTGSMAVSYRTRTRRVHAVPVVDGTQGPEATCGWPSPPPNPDVEPRDWETVNFKERCRSCAEALGEPTAVVGR